MASEDFTPYNWTNRALLVLGFFALVGMVITHNDRFFWDEPYYFHNLDLIKSLGWSHEFLKQEWGSAGPLYTVVHYYLLPLTQAHLPHIRFVNIGLLLVIMGLSAIFISRYMNESIWGGLLYLAIPMTYVCSGVALTEIPSFVFLILSLLCLFGAFQSAAFSTKNLVLAISGGFLFGVAVMGRQPLLVSLGALPFMFIDKKLRCQANYGLVLAFIFSALPLPLYVFSVWQGLLAPKEQITSEGLAPWHLILGLGYISLTTFILSPNYFVRLEKKYTFGLLCLGLIILMLNFSFDWLRFTPMLSLLITYLPYTYCLIISSIFASLVIVVGLYYLYSSYYRIQNAKNDGILIFMTVSILLLAVTSIKITHQYSSRYAYQAAPFLVFQLARFSKDDTFSLLRYSLGIAIGLGSLYSYIAY